MKFQERLFLNFKKPEVLRSVDNIRIIQNIQNYSDYSKILFLKPSKQRILYILSIESNFPLYYPNAILPGAIKKVSEYSNNLNKFFIITVAHICKINSLFAPADPQFPSANPY